MPITIKTINGEIIETEAKPSDSVASVKTLIEKKTGVCPAKQRLICSGLVLPDEAKL